MLIVLACVRGTSTVHGYVRTGIFDEPLVLSTPVEVVGLLPDNVMMNGVVLWTPGPRCSGSCALRRRCQAHWVLEARYVRARQWRLAGC